ncbi:MAG: hypothetical protein M1387_08645 [Thaumarchaeota archaeon]|nr:hypothetical protein [Nitrososphaerota archaeon]
MTGNLLLVSSNRDSASRNMAQHLIENYGFKETSEQFEDSPIYQKDETRLIRTEKELLHLNDPGFKPDAYIFLSKHRSESQIPTLTAHFPGNFSEDASYGGNPRELGYTYPSLHRAYLKNLEQLREHVPDYKIVTEPMHHGPTSFQTPVLFVEIGSSEERWNDQLAVETVCEAVVKTITNHHSPAEKIAVGFGGTHYSEKFTQLVIETSYALGAIAPKYALQHINQPIINQMKSRCSEKITYAIIDWKGVNDRPRIISLAEETGLEIVKV